MKVLALSASPNLNGNSAHLLDQLLEGAREAGAETERLDVSRMQIRGCQGDFACKKSGRCAIKDDMQAIYDKIDQADSVVFTSPVYMGTVNAQLKAVLDRLFQYMNMDLSTRIQPAKRSALIVTQGQPDEALFRAYLNAVPGALNHLGFGDTEVLVGGGLRAQGDAAQRPDLQARAREIGKRLARA